MKTPLISVIVPVYNTEIYMLEKCFESILNQNNENFELVVIDDGSNSKTASFLDTYKEKFPCIKLIHNKNGGASVARNTGIQVSCGKFITFIDADDWIEPDYIDMLLREFDTDADIVMCTRVFEYKTKSIENHFFDEDITFCDSAKKTLILKSITSGVAGTWCKVYRKDFLERFALKYDPKLRRTQDIIFNLYAFKWARKIRYIDQCKYHYRMQNESVTKKYNPEADKILTLAAREFEIYVDRFYPDDSEIRQALYLKCLNILHEICKLKIFNGKYAIGKKERYCQMDMLCMEIPYKTAIESYTIKDYPSLLGKVRLVLLKKKAYNLLFYMYKLQGMIEQRRNY